MEPHPPSYPEGQGNLYLPAPVVRPRLTYIIMGTTIVFYLLQIAGRFILGFDLLLTLGAKSTPAIQDGQLWRLITPILLHASISHIFFNMYALFILGTSLESVMGLKRFLLLYLLAGFSGNVLSFLLGKGISVGASTSTFGLIAAQAIFLYQNRSLLPNARQSLNRLLSVLVLNLFLSLSPGIDLWGHLGGLFGGAIFAWLAGPHWQVEGLYPSQRVIDRREGRDVLLGASLVLLIFGALTALKIGLF